MILNDTEDTIVALATPVGEGALAVLRLSGPQAISIVDKHFRGKKPLREQASHTVHHGNIVDAQGVVIDEVLCTLFKAPRSYTGEDVVEISCHGGLFVTRQILAVFTEAGARLAKPGEFTRRAFLNGKLDLSQAEAVADLIQSRSERAHKSSLDQLSGKLSREIQKLRDDIAESLRLLELELDFVEEDIEFVDKHVVEQHIEKALESITKLLETFKVGKVYREGVRVVLAGEPNVGKSSLLNALLQQDRAIVTHIPGTTRDFLEEPITIDGILFRLIDTAGLRATDDPVEREGVRRTKEIASVADILLIVIDAAQGERSLKTALSYFSSGQQSRALIVCNKADLLANREQNEHSIHRELKVIETSALTGAGIDRLKKELVSFALENESVLPEASVIVTNSRHAESLMRAKDALKRANESLKQKASNEFVAVDLRLALDHLGEIIGAVTSDEILNGIFAKFCIGK